MDKNKKKKGSGWLLWLLVVVSIAVVGGWKWMEHLSTREAERNQLLAQFQKEKSDLALKLSLAERAARVSGSEAERLLAEKTLLEAKLADCGKKPKPTAKRVTPRSKKTRVVKPRETAPDTQPQESLAHKLEKVCGGRPAKCADGKCICEKQKPVATTNRDDFFAKAVDEEVGEVATPVVLVRTRVAVAYVAPVYQPLLRPNCMSGSFRDPSDGRFYAVGYQPDHRTNGQCQCGSDGCDLRWPQKRPR